MGQNASVGHGQCPAIGHERDFVRTHAVGGKLPDTPEAVVGVVEAEDATLAIEIVLGRDQVASIGREAAVTVEMAIVPAFDDPDQAPRREVDDRGEGAGAAGEQHRLFARGRNRRPVTTSRQAKARQDRAVRRNQASAVPPVPAREGSNVGFRMVTRPSDARKERCRADERDGTSSVDRHRLPIPERRRLRETTRQ